jgi:ATP-dependent Zn protease
MVTQYGMVESLGTINYSGESGYQKMFSERTGAMIDAEVRNIINEQYKACRVVLEQNKDKIER